MSELSASAPPTPNRTFQDNHQLRVVLEFVGWVIVIGLLGLGLNSVIDRALFLVDAYAQPVADPDAAFGPFDGRYYEHYLATIGHLIPATLIVFTGPLQFIRRIRTSYRTLHRISGRIFIVCGFIGAATGFFIGAIYPFMGVKGAGFNESMATVVIAGYTFVALSMAYLSARRRQFAVHREWVIRSFSIMLGIATERVMLGTLMATTEIGTATLFGATFWMAAVVHVLAAELWIRLTRTGSARHWKDVVRG